MATACIVLPVGVAPCGTSGRPSPCSLTAAHSRGVDARNHRYVHGSTQQLQASSICVPSRSHRPALVARLFPFDLAWSPTIDSASIAPKLFAASLLPYLVFLYFLHSSGKTPRLTLFGFYFLLAFVGATIPAGIYAKIQYGTSLANVDWLHGAAESLLTVTNLLIVLGFRQGIRDSVAGQQGKAEGQVEADMAAGASVGAAPAVEEAPLKR